MPYPDRRNTDWYDTFRTYLEQTFAQRDELTPAAPTGLQVTSDYGAPNAVTWDEPTAGAIPVAWQYRVNVDGVQGAVRRTTYATTQVGFIPELNVEVEVSAIGAFASQWASVSHVWQMDPGPGALAIEEGSGSLRFTLTDFTINGAPFDGYVGWQGYVRIPSTGVWITEFGGGLSVTAGQATPAVVALTHEMDFSQVKIVISNYDDYSWGPYLYQVPVVDRDGDGFPTLPLYGNG